MYNVFRTSKNEIRSIITVKIYVYSINGIMAFLDFG